MPPAARDTLDTFSISDPVGWWGEPGRAGFVPDAALMMAWPWPLAGLTVGGIDLVEPFGAPAAQPWPGLPGARAPLATWDSLAVEPPRGAWDGFGAALANVAWRSRPVSRRTRATLGLSTGTQDLDDNAIAVERGDSLRGLGVDIESGTRGVGAGIASAGRHAWGARAAFTRGHHTVDGAFAQRGWSGTLQAGENEDGRGTSGFARWRWNGPHGSVGATWARSVDQRSSFGDTLFDSRRDAQHNVASVESAWGAAVSARAQWSSSEVRRAGEGAATWRDHAWWAAARARQPLGAGALELGVGGGRDDATRSAVAPQASWEGRFHAWGITLAGSRLLDPVWSDLAPGAHAFLQDTWAGGLSIVHAAPRSRIEGSVTGGRTRDRALVLRAPMDEVWLRAGVQSEVSPYRFVLATGRVSTGRGPWEIGAEGYGLGTGRTSPEADPRAGGRGWLQFAFTGFQGDLGVRLRLEGAGVGIRRANDGTLLPAYGTTAVGVVLTLGDATLSIRATNLEDARHPQPWIDPVTGLPALGERRMVRTLLTWRLYN